METSKIYDLFESTLLHKWKSNIEKNESQTCFFTIAEETFSELEKALNAQQKNILKSYSLAIENKLDYLYYNLEIKILNLGIKIGMELQKAFYEFSEE